MILVALILVAVVLDYLSRFKRKTVVLEHQFRLYALRDSLRELVMKGEVKASNWVFQYLDSSIAKSIERLPLISVWRVCGMMAFQPEDRKLPVLIDHLQRELSKPGNEALQRIHLHYLAEMGAFLIHRHKTLRFSLGTLCSLFNLQKWVRTNFRLAKQLLTASSETSTLSEFVPA
jgi:hypothetical protein